MKKIKKNLDDILLLGGCGCIVYGLSLWSPTAAWVAAGLLMFGWAFLIGKATDDTA